MPDLLAGSTVRAADTPVSVTEAEAGNYTFTNTTYGVGTTGGTYSDCGRSFTAPTTGRVLILWNAWTDNAAATDVTYVAPHVRLGSTVGSGSTFFAASDAESLNELSTSQRRNGASLLLEGLTPGTVYNVRLEHRVTANTGTAQHRSVIVVPAP